MIEARRESAAETGSGTAAHDAPVILEAREIYKHFAGVVALSSGNFDLHDNEVHAIVGDNGAGKSTLLKILSGALQPDGGAILMDGQSISIPNPSEARRMGISTVFQDLALIDHLDASANMFLGREVLLPPPFSWLGVLDRRAMRERAAAEVRRLKVGVRSVDQLVAGMSGGQRQCVAVARAVAFGTRIVIMDEPTAALGVRERGAVIELIKEIKAQGLSVVVISHSMPDVFEIADRITVLRLGRTVTTLQRNRTNLQEIVATMTGALEAQPKTAVS